MANENENEKENENQCENDMTEQKEEKKEVESTANTHRVNIRRRQHRNKVPLVTLLVTT